MEQFWSRLQKIDYANIPVTQIILIVLVLTITQVLRRIIPRFVAKSLDHLVAQTGRELNEQILGVIKMVLP